MVYETNEQPSWSVNAEERVFGLEVVLLKQTYVLPWSQFVYAEGAADEVTAAFTTHDVVVKGSGLNALMSDFAAQRVTVVREPSRADRFRKGVEARITEVSVRKIEASEEDDEGAA